MHINVSGLLRNFARVRRAALAGETVVIATRDGNLVLAAQPDPPGAAEGAGGRSGAVPAPAPTRESASRAGAPAGEPRPGGASRFVARAVVADAARSAPRIDAERFRADLDALIDPHFDG